MVMQQDEKHHSVFDVVIVSDLHLGSLLSKTELFLRFLEEIKYQTRLLILNGDILDDISVPLPSSHWRVLLALSQFNRLFAPVRWIRGNHDNDSVVAETLGLISLPGITLQSGNKKIVVIHGNMWDDYVEKHKILVKFNNIIYWVIQRIDPTHFLAHLGDLSINRFSRCIPKVREGALRYAEELDANIICCGHTHEVDETNRENIQYLNGGTWIKIPSHYIGIKDGNAQIFSFRG